MRRLRWCVDIVDIVDIVDMFRYIYLTTDRGR